MFYHHLVKLFHLSFMLLIRRRQYEYNYNDSYYYIIEIDKEIMIKEAEWYDKFQKLVYKNL